MKFLRSGIPLFIFIGFISVVSSAQTRTVTGMVLDAANKHPLPFCSIALFNSTSGVNADGNGKFKIEINQSIKSPQLIIAFIGYKTDTLLLSENKTDYPIYLTKTAGSLNAFVVTGVSKATLIRENPLPMESVSLKQIESTAADNVIDAITKNAPGFEAVKTGPNVSKPFINGLGYNRVLTIYDGMRVETQQWGDEHGVPMDDYIIGRAEIIEGPASLMYGSDAIAGVLSLFPVIPNDTDRTLHGKVLSEYQTNNGLIGNSFQLSYANPHWSYQITGSERIAKNYENSIDGRVFNTGFKEVNASGFIGYKNENGYSHLNATFYDNRQGIPDGSRDSLTRQFTYQIYETKGENAFEPLLDNIKNRPIVSEADLNSYALSPLSQRIQDYRVYSNNFYKIGESDFKLLIGGEQNIRREYNHPTDTAQAGEYIVLNTLDYSFSYNAPTFSNIESSVGVNGMYQNNTSKDATDFPIPDYNLFDVGTYAYAKWKYHKWTIAGGARFDHRSEDGKEMYIKSNPETGFFEQVSPSDTLGAIKQFSSFKLNFQGVSGSIGTTYLLNNNISFKANIARGYRAPNITEIASNGLDPGAHIYYEGNLDFIPEFSLQEDMGLSGDYKNYSFDLSIYNNNIQHYIYEAQKVDANGNPIVIVPGNKTFQYQQANAQLYGLNATFNVFPENWKGFSFNNAVSFVYGFNTNPIYKNAGVEGAYLPFIPPPRWLSSINQDIEIHKKRISKITLKAEMDCNVAQNRYFGLYKTETETDAYTLFNISAIAHFKYSKNNELQFQVAVNNISNTAYQSHLSRLQYFEYYTQSPNGHLGIYNMGRNFCFRLILPF